MDYKDLVVKHKESLLEWTKENPAPLLRWLFDENVLSETAYHGLLEKTQSNRIIGMLEMIWKDDSGCRKFMKVLREVQDYYPPELEAWLNEHYRDPVKPAPAKPNEEKKPKCSLLSILKPKVKKYNLPQASKDEDSKVAGTLRQARFKVPLITHKKNILKRTEKIVDHVDDEQSRTHIEIRYTDLFVTEEDDKTEVSQHEYFSLANRRARIYNHQKFQRIQPQELLSADPLTRKIPKRVKVKGIAGIGKSIAMQRVIHEWALGISMRNFTCVVDFTFRELNLITGKVSLLDLLSSRFDHLKGILPDLLKAPKSVLFLLDGLDEFKYRLNFEDQEKLINVDTKVPVQELVVSLIKASLLPEASIIITTRPSTDIPKKFFQKSAIILGFEKKQVEEYCSKFYKDSQVAQRVCNYIIENDNLFGLSFIPLYCYIICMALSNIFNSPNNPKKPFELNPPKTVSEVYYCYLYTVIRHHALKDEKKDASKKHIFSVVKMELMNLGKLAYHNLLSSKILFDKKDLETFGIKPKNLHSTFLTQILTRVKEEQVEMFSFFHMTIQEHLAALYCVVNLGEEDILEGLDLWFFGTSPNNTTKEILCDSTRLLDRDKLENLQMFTRFLMGLVKARLEGNLTGLTEILSNTFLNSLSQWFKCQFSKEVPNPKTLNLLHCLMELQQDSVAKEVSPEIKRLNLFKMTLNIVDCAALYYILQYSPNKLEELNLGYANIGYQGLRRLGPILHKCESLFLRYNCLDKEAAILESSILRSPDCCVKKLFMCGNNIGSEGVLELWTALEKNNTVEELYLDITGFTETGTENIVSCLSQNRTLKTLTIVGNDIGEQGKQRMRDLSKRRSSLKIIGNFVDDMGLLDAYLGWVEELKVDRDQMDSVKNVDALQSVLRGLSLPAQGKAENMEKAKELKQKIQELLNAQKIPVKKI
nr:PREDICTED: protein NLRC3-like isoform X1 [Lepisosteus oculatus]